MILTHLAPTGCDTMSQAPRLGLAAAGSPEPRNRTWAQRVCCTENENVPFCTWPSSPAACHDAV
jgi:hypothetical protein